MAEMVKPDRKRLMEMIHKTWPGPEEAHKAGLSDEELFRTDDADELMPSGTETTLKEHFLDESPTSADEVKDS